MFLFPISQYFLFLLNSIVFLKPTLLISAVKPCLELLNIQILPYSDYCYNKLLFFFGKSSRYFHWSF